MSSIRYCIYTVLSILMLGGWGADAAAQTPLSLNVSRADRNLKPGKETEYQITVRNTSALPVEFRVIRVVNEFPDSIWYSSMCHVEYCYPKETDTLPSKTLSGGGSTLIYVHVATSLQAGKGRVVLQFDTGEGSATITQQLTVTVLPASGIAEESGEPSKLGAFPNPAISVVTLPLESLAGRKGIMGEEVTLDLIDLGGHHVMDLSAIARAAIEQGRGELMVDVREIPNGIYLYRLRVGKRMATGRMTITR